MGRARVLTASRLALLLVLLVACNQTSGTARGPVIDVAGDLVSVSAFTVLVEGEEYIFVPVEDGDYAFPLQHLVEHRRTGEHVFVGWELIEGVRYALSLDDG